MMYLGECIKTHADRVWREEGGGQNTLFENQLEPPNIIIYLLVRVFFTFFGKKGADSDLQGVYGCAEQELQ